MFIHYKPSTGIIIMDFLYGKFVSLFIPNIIHRKITLLRLTQTTTCARCYFVLIQNNTNFDSFNVEVIRIFIEKFRANCS